MTPRPVFFRRFAPAMPPRRTRHATDESQLDVFAVAATLAAMPAQRPAVILEDWRRPGSLFVYRGRLEAPAVAAPEPPADDVLADMARFVPDVALLPGAAPAGGAEAVVIGDEDTEHLMLQGLEGPEPARVPARHVPRVIQLCKIRDAARRVLHAELANAPDFQLDELRRGLNEVYDEFVRTYGPINLESVDARGVARRPNLTHMEKDPDWPLLCGLEVVDTEHGIFDKAPIFERPVIRHVAEAVKASTPADALALSLDRRGGVDIPFMAALLGQPEGKTIEDLAGAIFLNPETERYEPASEYLSGTVRHKLRVAEERLAADPRWQANVDALRAVQPAMLTEEQITPALGATWIPASDVHDFLAHLLQVPRDWVDVSVEPRLAKWKARPHRDQGHLRHAALATREWGTDRINLFHLLEHALNGSDPTVSDPVPGTEPTKYVINQGQTLAAREKLTAIKAEFTQWIWRDNARAVRLVQDYNARYNDRVERVYDGAHMSFPGMSKAVELRPHQRNAIWRALQSGNTLLAHEVGTGKTFVEAAIAIESKRLGMARKPAITVPNHMIEQVTRDIMQLYPMAKLLVGSKDDLDLDKRQEFIGRVAMSDCDLVLLTHNAFQRIPLSPDTERGFITERVQEFQIVPDGEDADERRMRLAALRRWQKKLDELGTRDDQDHGITFEETGIDMLIVDEAHYFKGLAVDSKNRNRATQPSKRAEDLYLRTRYLQRLNPGRGLVFATGTPITNSVAELWVLQKFMQEERLRDLGLHHFDAWAATFGQSVTSFELAPGGGYRLNTRFAAFQNVPELMALTREFMDVCFTEDLNLPVPEIRGGAPENRVVPATEAQELFFQELTNRDERRRRKEGDYKQDNILKIIGEARRAAVDLRLVDPEAADDPNTKLRVIARAMAEIYRQYDADRGTQLAFGDVSTPAGGMVNSYQILHDYLVEEGIPPEEIAFAQNAKSDKAKARLQAAINEGRIRICLGSTDTLGTGTNVQERLIALHHIDPPWRPADMQQREGRIRRQGNMWPEVIIIRWATERSFDAYIYQGLERKQRFIHMALKGDKAVRHLEEVDGVAMSFATMKAIATGNPLIREKAETEVEIARLQILVRQERDQRFYARQSLAELPAKRERAARRLHNLHRDLEHLVPTTAENFRFVLPDGTVLDKREDAGRHMIRACMEVERHATDHGSSQLVAGHLAGFQVYFEKVRGFQMRLVVQQSGVYDTGIDLQGRSAFGLVRSAEYLINHLPEREDEYQARVTQLDTEEQNLQRYIDQESLQQQRLDELLVRLEDLNQQLGIGADPEQEQAAEAEAEAQAAPRARAPRGRAPRALPAPAPAPALAPALADPAREARINEIVEQALQEDVADVPAPHAPRVPPAEPAPAPADGGVALLEAQAARFAALARQLRGGR